MLCSTKAKKPFSLRTLTEATIWRLPDCVELEGDVYPINTDFRAGVAFHTAAQSGEPISVGELLALYFPDRTPRDADRAAEAAIAFFRCGAPAEQGKQSDTSPPPYSYFADGEAIAAAFMARYRIDLDTAELHWWQFCALLRGLLEPSFAERVQARCTDLGGIKDKDAKARIRRMQERFALDRHGRPQKAPQTLEEYEAMLFRQARGE